MAASISYRSPVEKLKALIAAGADVNAQDNDGETALMPAARYHFEQPDVAAFLIEAGARRDIRDTNVSRRWIGSKEILAAAVLPSNMRNCGSFLKND